MKKEEIVELQTEALGINEELGELLLIVRLRASEHRSLFKYYDDLDEEIVAVRNGITAVNPNLFKLANLLESYEEHRDE